MILVLTRFCVLDMVEAEEKRLAEKKNHAKPAVKEAPKQK